MENILLHLHFFCVRNYIISNFVHGILNKNKLNDKLSILLLTDENGDTHACDQGLYVLPKDEIGCLATIPRWYHDHASGECKEFSYDGCKKNENNFETKDECDTKCKAWHEEHKGHQHTHGHSHEHHH